MQHFPENNVKISAKETTIAGAACRIVAALVNGMQLTNVKNCPIHWNLKVLKNTVRIFLHCSPDINNFPILMK